MRRRAERLLERRRDLEEERALVGKYDQFFGAFEAIIASESRWSTATAYHIVLREGATEAAESLRTALEGVLGDGFEIRTAGLGTGETGVLLLLPAAAGREVERILREAGVEEVRAPAGYGATVGEALPRMRERLAEIPGELAATAAELTAERAGETAWLERARRELHDRLTELEALGQAALTAHGFVLEGWTPSRSVPVLASALRAAFGEGAALEEVSRESWSAADAPVVLSNPRLFRPFELIVRMMPLPRYGSIDPTPFVAVFFPMFCGLMLGDMGYGAVLAALSLVLHLRSRPGSTLRQLSEIGGACAGFTIIFGALYGEVFGDLGMRLLGIRPLLFDRAEALLPFLALAVSIGLVHVLLGLVLGMLSHLRQREGRAALGRGLSALLVVLILLALLAATEVLPRAFYTPAIVTLLVAFPVLVLAEGIIAPIELLATLGNVLSYARIMALGTASVMMAVVANRMVGTMGSVFVGVLFALLFHLVNFALGLFSPGIHALRLHYVEFFGKFFSPGGTRYEPFRHWRETGSTETRERSWSPSGSP